jgi:glyoxylase-like metal-dependent hydrolase (beta-lactamase superfamily II)
MTPPDYRVISIGTLAAHPLWEEKVDVRTGHATTTLVTVGEERILVDPALPAQIIEARLAERSRVRASEITHVFVTSFTRDHHRGVGAFRDAEWLLHAPEREAAGAALTEQMQGARQSGDPDVVGAVGEEIDLLRRFRTAPDRLAPGVDLFPLPGVTPGCCGLLLSLPGRTVLICGDAIPTVEHLQQGKVLPGCADIAQAQESFREAVEIADVLILGRDNVVYNPLRTVG